MKIGLVGRWRFRVSVKGFVVLSGLYLSLGRLLFCFDYNVLVLCKDFVGGKWEIFKFKLVEVKREGYYFL